MFDVVKLNHCIAYTIRQNKWRKMLNRSCCVFFFILFLLATVLGTESESDTEMERGQRKNNNGIVHQRPLNAYAFQKLPFFRCGVHISMRRTNARTYTHHVYNTQNRYHLRAEKKV